LIGNKKLDLAYPAIVRVLTENKATLQAAGPQATLHTARDEGDVVDHTQTSSPTDRAAKPKSNSPRTRADSEETSGQTQGDAATSNPSKDEDSDRTIVTLEMVL
jgi:hypothetical protein